MRQVAPETRTTPRSTRRAVTTALGGLVAAACGKSGKDDAALVLGDQVHLVRSRLEAAGELKGLPFQARWADFPGAAPLLEALNAGAVDTAFAGDIPVILAAAAGCPLKIVAATRSSGREVAILTPPGSDIRRVGDLKGRQVIVSSARGSIAHYLLLERLDQAGVKPSDVNIGFLSPIDASSAFAAGKIEAWATFGVYQFVAEAQGAQVLADGQGVNPGYGLIAASQQVLRNPVKRRALAEFLVRLQHANAWSVAHPTDYARLLSNATHMPATIATRIAALENSPLAAPNAVLVAALQHAADRLAGFGVIPRAPDIRALIDAQGLLA